MSQLVEKVAKAISDKYAPAVDAKAPYAKVMCIEAAKAAIEAMKELPKDVLNLVETSSIHYSKEEIWGQFIDAILKSK